MTKVKLHGFTLIELIVVIIISGIIFASSTALLVQAAKGYVAGREDINANWQTGLALERMTRDLHEVASISSAVSNQLVVKDIHGITINYKLNSKALQLLRNDQVLADKVKDITFTYYDADGVTTNDIGAIRYVGISLNLIYTTLIALWNVK
jgi:prepilin-type N-terminal cleavage/methylation domain-containing protein